MHRRVHLKPLQQIIQVAEYFFQTRRLGRAFGARLHRMLDDTLGKKVFWSRCPLA
jgi:hypothetical protein